MEKKKEWTGSVNLAMKLEGGDSNEEREIDGDFQTRWERERQRFRISGQIEYDTTGGNATKQDWMIVLRYDQFFPQGLLVTLFICQAGEVRELEFATDDRPGPGL